MIGIYLLPESDSSSDKNKHSQVTEVMRMIIKANKNLESTLCHNDEIRAEKRFRMDETREEERVHMA